MIDKSSIQVPSTIGCAFCDYLAERRPYTILKRSPLTAILVTREQRGSSHLLILPVVHRETILDLTPDEASAVMSSVIEAAQLIDAADERPGIAIWQNNGIPADQTIPHVHFHVAGTLREGATERGTVRELSLQETDAIARKLRRFLASPPSSF